MLTALIMAGGKGTRFWPLSTEEKPKQFLKLLSEDTMIQMTVKRLESLIPIDRIFIVTAKQYVNLVEEQLPMLPKRNIIVEPVGKNTAPCIALSAFIIDKCYKDATIAVLPSDHLISNDDKFIKTLNTAYEFVEKEKDAIVTLGMRPDRPETGYGYIKLKDESGEWKVKKQNSSRKFENIYKVEKFVEKPNIEKAEEYLKDGNYLWNGGMFIWKTSTILNLTEKYLNNTYNILNEIAVTNEENFNEVLEEKYHQVDEISVDYGIMENANNIYVIPSDFGWDDIGTWYALERYREKDENNNICVGDVKNIDSCNNIVVGNNKPIIVTGISDVFVVESDDVIFIGNRESIDNIKEIREKYHVSNKK
ncbi:MULTISPECIES: mannose-1-phosphate guanylyltransferase [Clostridium]|uniref:mannose-1-phosphate guanylyltransferase n=2 Tax=Clostridium TaxID=1485 RepID=A0A151AKU7_9CLOT|nr:MULTISPECIES: mannose-1-phosphate guanylyltransferase [Clostridium]KYH28017.1 alginate biosynthesis protein AlgA [Clostridium colicanis DSM 13634]PRR76514.1 Alginate biosynthesis protein AlgA [Clostridium thermopalmarium DSM 5974]PVZ28373.1 mannose-1-phosphate guanylyltransferase [Clostridium thermopalmarium DSM 5974]